MRRSEVLTIARFVVAGVANAAMTGAVLIVMATQINIALAYTIVYVIGLTFTTVVSSSFVFRSRLTVGRGIRFVTWYVSVYFVGVCLVKVSAGRWHASHLLTTITVVAITAPLNFLGGRWIFHRSRPISGYL